MFLRNVKLLIPDWLKAVIFFVIVFFYASTLKGQSASDSLFLFRAKLLTADSLLPLPDAHVISRHLVWGTISDSSGYFQLHVDDNDTLLISSLGFRNTLYVVDSALHNIDTVFFIKIYRDTITLNEVLIRAFWDYETFKQMVIDMRLPDDIKIDATDKDRLLNRPLQPGVSGPVQALYNLFNHTVRLERKLTKNRKHYNRMMIQMGRPQDTIPPIPEHMQARPHSP